MITVKLVRGESTDQGTFGRLSAPGFSCFTGELPWRDNRRGLSCIPPGSYLCEYAPSPRFGMVYHVREVPGRSHVLIHSGNMCGDKTLGWKADVEGCILLGKYTGRLTNPNGVKQRAVLSSKPTVRAFVETLKQEPFILEVT